MSKTQVGGRQSNHYKTMLPESDTPRNLEQYADKDLARFIQEQEQALEGRKLIAEGLLFVGCQVLSNALAMLLFQYAVRIWVTYLIIWAVALTPALGDLCNVHFSQEDQGWRITLMRSPIKTVVKVIFSVGVLAVGIHEVRDLLVQTYNGIYAVHNEIKAYEMPKSGNYDITSQMNPLAALSIATAIVFLVVYLRERK